MLIGVEINIAKPIVCKLKQIWVFTLWFLKHTRSSGICSCYLSLSVTDSTGYYVPSFYLYRVKILVQRMMKCFRLFSKSHENITKIFPRSCCNVFDVPLDRYWTALLSNYCSTDRQWKRYWSYWSATGLRYWAALLRYWPLLEALLRYWGLCIDAVQ